MKNLFFINLKMFGFFFRKETSEKQLSLIEKDMSKLNK